MVGRKRRIEIEAMKNGKHQAWIAEMVAVLGFADPETVASRWWGVAGQLHDLAHRDALALPRAIDDTFSRLWDEAQEVYDLLSRQFASSFLATMPLIDKLAAKKTPGKKSISALRNTVPQSVVALDRFFSRLDSPAWLERLRRTPTTSRTRRRSRATTTGRRLTRRGRRGSTSCAWPRSMRPARR